MPPPSPMGAGYRSPGGGLNDVTNGLAHQFQHQNLGGNTPRSASPYGRQPSPGTSSRPRTGGQTQYGSYLGGGMNSVPQGPSIYDDEPPPKNPDKYSTAITERVKLQKMLTQEFFKENVERARARNERFVRCSSFPTKCVRWHWLRRVFCRAKELEVTLQSKDLSDARKEQRKNNMRKSEANFLRFLRTSERPQNYNTLKIIGKGAFGEVRLVQRKHDGKIYALKSLIKAEMVTNSLPLCCESVLTFCKAQERPACSRPSRARHPGERGQCMAREAPHVVSRLDFLVHVDGVLAWR